MERFVSIIRKLLWLFILSLLLYILTPKFLAYFPTKERCSAPKEKIVMLYNDNPTLLSHTELIFYIKDVRELLPSYITKFIGKYDRYISFSYGDKAFMLGGKGFDEMDTEVVLKALFSDTPALIKVGYYDDIKKELIKSKKIPRKCFKKLIQDILSYTTPQLVPSQNAPYYYRYFLSNSSYNLFFTCNSWTLKVLRDSGISMPLWSPFADEILSKF